MPRELGLKPDRFWQEIGAEDRQLLVVALARFPNDRARLVMTLQRQNFFVPAAELAAARAELIRALARSDEKAFEKARSNYQVDQVEKFFESPAGIPIRVRLFEFVAPHALSKDGTLHPLIRAFLAGGAASPGFGGALAAAKPRRWRE